MDDEGYHQRLKEEKRAAALRAAMQLFFEQGYERTTLQQIAKRANLSTATLFKRFSSKAALFEAIVEEFWRVDGPPAGIPPAGDPAAGLHVLGSDYARRMRRPEMAALYRVIIAEVSRSPQLGQYQAERHKGPYLDRIATYLAAEVSAGTLSIPDVRRAAHQFMGLITAEVLNPGLLFVDFAVNDEETKAAVDEAVGMIVGRYARTSLAPERTRGLASQADS